MSESDKPRLMRPLLPGRSSALVRSAEPGRWMPRRPSTHVRDTVCLFGTGVAGYGLADVLGQQWGPAALIGGSLAGAAAVTGGTLQSRRGQVEDLLVEALAPILGLDGPDRRAVRTRSWSRGWPGTPRKITLRYAAGCSDADPAWKAGVVSVVEGRLLVPFEVVEHDRRTCVLRLRAVVGDTDSEAAVETSLARVRAERAVHNLIGATASVTGVEFDEAGQLTSLSVTHEAGERVASAGYRARVERVISTMHPGRWRARWDLEGDAVTFEVQPAMPESIWLPLTVPDNIESLLEDYDSVEIPYAVDADGQEIVWMPARSPQMLISGGTGSGKTSTTHSIVAKITQYGWPVWVLDGKRVEFLLHRDWPNVQVVATTVEQQVALVHRVYQLMRERFRLMEDEGLSPGDFEPLFVVLDEWADFVAELLEWYPTVKQKGDPTRPPTLREEASIVRQARLARIHLTKTMQRPDVSLLGGQGGEVRSNFTQRISVGRCDPQGAMMMWDSPAIGVTIPRGARQRSTTTGWDGAPVEVQCYRAPSMTAPEDSEEGRLRSALQHPNPAHERLLIVPPQPVSDLDGGPDLPVGFWEYAEAEWVRACDRPDLDPVLRGRRRRSREEGRAAASALRVLGLSAGDVGEAADIDGPVETSPAGEEAVESRASSGLRHLRLVDDAGGPTPTDEWATDLHLDEYAGYAEATTCPPRDLMIGDLIQADDDGVWVVVDEAPEDDPAEPGMIAVSWRGDGDEAGSVSLPDDTVVAVRHPEETFA